MPARRHLVEHDAEGEEIRAGIQILTPCLLGGHVGHRPQRRTGTGQQLFLDPRRHLRAGHVSCPCAALWLHLCQSEVEDLGLPALGDEDVRRLDVAVDDPLGVGGVQGVGKLDSQLEQLLRLEGLSSDAVLERLALQELHGDEGLALVLVDVVDRTDVGVVEGGAGLGLAPEPLQGDLVAEELLRQELQRDESVEAGVLGPVDDAHAPGAQLFDDAVVGDGLADHVPASPCEPILLYLDPSVKRGLVRPATTDCSSNGVSRAFEKR